MQSPVCVNVAKFESPTVNNACVQNKISPTQHGDLILSMRTLRSSTTQKLQDSRKPLYIKTAKHTLTSSRLGFPPEPEKAGVRVEQRAIILNRLPVIQGTTSELIIFEDTPAS